MPLGIVGAILPVLLAMRDKTANRLDALWSGSADLLAEGRKYPGQLSLTADSLAWVPSKYSIRHGLTEFSCRSDAIAGLDSGSALLDLVITVRSATRGETRFLTRMSVLT